MGGNLDVATAIGGDILGITAVSALTSVHFVVEIVISGLLVATVRWYFDVAAAIRGKLLMANIELGDFFVVLLVAGVGRDPDRIATI